MADDDQPASQSSAPNGQPTHSDRPTVYDRTVDETGALVRPVEAPADDAAPDAARDAGVAPSRARHARTAGQRALLAASVATIAACFVGAAGLVGAKMILDRRQVLDISAAAGTVPPLPAVADTDPPSTRSSGSVASLATDAAGTAGGTTGATTGAPTVATSQSAPGTAASGASSRPVAPIVSSAPSATFPPSPDATNFLVAAADTNGCPDPGSPWSDAVDPKRPANSRSDSIMVIRVDPSTNRVAILSFPRDLWVRIPGRGSQRINAAYRENNPERLIQTIVQNFGVPIDRYLQVDFCAFKRIVEAVGGVDVSFARPIKDPSIRLLIPDAGCHHFVGDEALAYLRSRHLSEQLDNGKWKKDTAADFGRIARQQDFLTRVLAKALNRGMFDPSVARGVITTLTNGELVASAGMSIDDFLAFAGVLRHVDPAAVRRYTINARGVVIGGNQVLDWKPFINSTEMRAILKIFRGEAQLPATLPPPPADTSSSGTGVTGDTRVAGDTGEPEDNTRQAILPQRDVAC